MNMKQNFNSKFNVLTMMDQMEQWKSKSNSWVTDFEIFAISTSAHGVKQIFVGRNKFVRLLFLLSWLACVVYSVYMIMTSIVTFINKPTGIKYEILHNDDAANSRKPQSIKFPTISICSHNKVKKSYLYKPGNEAIREYWSVVDMYDVGNASNINWEDPGMAAIANMTYQEVLAAGGPVDNRLLFCSQRVKGCEEILGTRDNYFVTEETISGKCWRINPNGLLYGKGGDYGKMTIKMFADLQDYSSRSADQPQYGFTVAFHDNETFGSTLSSGYYVSPGSIYKVDLRLKKEKREPPPGGNCNASLVHTTYGAYDEGACVMECKDVYVHAKCGCVNIVPPLKSKYNSCTLKEWAECGLQAYLNFSMRYRDPMLTENICPCPAACKETYYEAQLSSSSLSPAFTEYLYSNKDVRGMLHWFSNPDYNIIYNSTQDIMDNIMVLEVLFTSMVTSEIVQVVTYTSANLLGDIGGVLGLFLGASVFTIIEFCQLLFFGVSKHCFGRRSEEQDDEEEEEEEGKEKD